MDINRFYETLDKLYAGKESHKAEQYLQNCLEDARFDGDYGALILICNELGGYYRAVGKHEEGVPLYLLALDCIKYLGMEGTENHATTLVNQATNYAVWGKPQEALEIFEKAAQILKNLGIEVDFTMATLHNNMSILCQDMGDLSGAAVHLDKALKILCQLDDTYIEVATTYTNMAQIQLALGDTESALNFAEKSLEMFDAAKALDDVHYSAALEIYGQICMALGKYTDALVSLQKARMLVERDYGKDAAAYDAVSKTIEECKTLMSQGNSK